jgi:hypothetical protein
MSWVVVVLLTAQIAAAQPASRRGAQSGDEKSQTVILSQAMNFGSTTLKPGKYVLRLSKGRLSLVDTKTMRPAVTLKAQTHRASSYRSTAFLTQKTDPNGTLALSFHYKKKVFLIEGHPGKLAAPKRPKLGVQAQQQADLEFKIGPQLTDQQLIEEAIAKRFIRQVSHCGDRAHKLRWKSGQKEFVQCVCPMTPRWRLPKPKQTVLISHALRKGKNGLSLRVNPKGKVDKCQVWTGKKPFANTPEN